MSAQENGTYSTETLPLTQELVMEVLAARHRLGERMWPFPNTAKRALDALDALGLVAHKSGIVEGTRNAWLTDYGKASVLSDTYVPPCPHDVRHANTGRCTRCGQNGGTS